MSPRSLPLLALALALAVPALAQPGDEPSRPQTPQPPFPYRCVDVDYGHGEVSLAATLTLPPGDGPFPAAVLITGSGAQNRDEEIFGHKPFAVIADHLTRAGVAVLRADDRGVGGSNDPTPGENTSADYAADALAGVEFLRAHAAIDPERVGLIGHSEGGLIGPLAASRSADVAFVVMLAGTGVDGAEILLAQSEALGRAIGRDEAFLARQREGQRAAFEAIARDAEPAAVRAAIEAVVRVQVEGQPVDEPLLQTLVDRGVAQLASPWMRFFLRHDPRPALRAMKVPVLVLHGELDLQVLPEQNLPPIEAALADHPDATVLRFPGLNHLFQQTETGSPAEYGQLEETFNTAALDALRDWVVARFVR